VRSLRWKLILTSLLVVFIPIYLLNRYAIVFFDRFTRTDLERHLTHYAYIVGELYKRQTAPDPADAAAADFVQLLRDIAREIDARVQVLSIEGRVLYDSAPEPETGADLSARPEIAEARTGAYSARARLTDDRRYMYYYIARPIKNETKDVLGVVYLRRHTGPIITAIREMVANQRMATYLALAAAALTAAVLALTLTRRLRALMRRTRDFAAGRSALGPPLRGKDEIAELGRAIHRMAGEIEARSRYNRDFIRATMHELRTPLTAIRGAAEVLESGASEEPRARKRFLGNIRFQCDRLMQLAGDLRALTEVDSDARRAPRETVDYAAFVRATVDRLSDTFPEPRARLELDLPDERIPVRLAPGRMEQVLANLLDNAFRYTPPDGLVTITVRAAQGHAVTAVRDSGCGIPPSHLDRVFDRFFTTVRHDHPLDYGSGLGLAIVRTILRHHDGQIRVESEPGKGACFTFDLPVA